MSARIRTTLTALLAAGILASAVPAGTPSVLAAQALAHVRFIYRGLSVQPPAQPSRAGTTKMALYQQYALRTGAGQKASIGFPDGTALHLNQDTVAVLSSPHMTSVQQGEVAEYLAPGTNHQVFTTAAVASAIGTKFDIRTVGRTSTFVVLVGALRVSNTAGSVVVERNQETVVAPNSAPSPPTGVNAQAVFAWTDGIPTPDLGEDVGLHANGASIDATPGVGFSSEDRGTGGNHGISSIYDGLLSTTWESAAGQTTNQWVKVGFSGGSAYAISGVIIDAAAPAGSPSSMDLNHFAVLVSSTGTADSDFTRVYTGACRPAAGLQSFVFPEPVRARYAELYMYDNHGSSEHIAVSELEIVATTSLFAEPSAVAVDSAGSIFVADSVNDRIQKLSARGRLLAAWGSKGKARGHFLSPMGIALDRKGDIYVADTNNDRVQKLSPAGKVLASWGSFGGRAGQFFDPQGIAIDHSGNVFVADTFNDRVQKFSPSGKVLGVWGTEGSRPGQFQDPTGIAVDRQGDIYVADESNNRIQKLSAQGTVLAVWGTLGSGSGQFNEPSGVAVDAYGNIFVTDQFNNRIEELSPRGGFLRSWGTFGNRPGQFRLPWGPSIDAQGNVYVSDRFNGRVQKFSPAGKLLASWGRFASLPQTLGQPSGIALDSAGNVWVADRTNDRIQERDPQGHVRAVLGYHGEPADPAAGLGQFWYPSDLKIGSDGAIFVTDSLNGRVQELSPTGPVAAFGSRGSAQGQILLPWGVAVDGHNNVYVADNGSCRVTVFAGVPGQPGQWQFIRQWGACGTAPGQLERPTAIALDGSGHVYVADTMNQRVEEFTSTGTYLATVGPILPGYGRLFIPSALALDSDGNLYIGDGAVVVKVSPAGSVIGRFSLPAETAGSPGSIAGIALDPQGDLYLTDQQNDRIVKLSPEGSLLAIWT